MTFTLVQSDIDAYKNDGAVLLKNVISRKWLDRVAGAIERDILDPGPFCHSYEPEDGQGGSMAISELGKTTRIPRLLFRDGPAKM